jgi:poly(3-hydroxybutyrate) depolymerase
MSLPEGAQMYYSNKYSIMVPIAEHIAARIMLLGGQKSPQVQRYFAALDELADAEFLLLAE